VPPLQEAEQGEKLDQSVVLHVVFGHGTSTLQGCWSVKYGQGAPPLAACCCTTRVRIWVPGPHCELQGPQPDQGPTTQGTGHGVVAQVWDSLNTGQGAPPMGCCRMERVRVLVPPPHVTGQPDQSDHCPTTQSTVQGCALHVVVSSRVGHGAPPLVAGVRIVRERVAVPPPHVAEHGLHAAQPETTQS
jgi:hypothetical protein